MDINLEELRSGIIYKARISECTFKELPLKKDGWRFNWRKLGAIEGAFFYKIILLETPKQVQGIVMLTLINEEMVFMNNIEVAPHNYGGQGRFKNVAGALIAFACMKSFEWGENNYLGFLSFDSKTELVSLYQEKYGATWAMGQKMFIDPINGKKLMKKYLNVV